MSWGSDTIIDSYHHEVLCFMLKSVQDICRDLNLTIYHIPQCYRTLFYSKESYWGKSTESLALGFGSCQDFRVCEIKLRSGLHAGLGDCSGFFFLSLSLCSPSPTLLVCAHALSLKKQKTKKKKTPKEHYL